MNHSPEVMPKHLNEVEVRTQYFLGLSVKGSYKNNLFFIVYRPFIHYRESFVQPKGAVDVMHFLKV